MTKLSQYIKDHGINMVWLAEKLETKYTTLYSVVVGQAKLKADMAKKICELFNCTLDDII